jgi:hypothetical protein
MFNGRKRLLWILALIGVLAAVGAAFTASNTFGSNGQDLGYGAQNVSGATVTKMTYTLSSDGQTVDGVSFEAQGDLTQSNPVATGYVGFTVGGTPGPTVACVTGAYNAGSNITPFTCDTTSLAQGVATVQATDIAVAD